VDKQKPFNREESKEKRATIAKKNYAPQTFTTLSDVTGAFFATFANLSELCG